MDAVYHGLAAQWTGGLEMELRRAGVLDAMMSRGLSNQQFEGFEEALGREMSRLNGGSDAPTGNPMAVKAAEILNRYAEFSRVAQNKQGAFIGKAKGYIGAQTHDAVRIACRTRRLRRRRQDPIGNRGSLSVLTPRRSPMPTTRTSCWTPRG